MWNFLSVVTAFLSALNMALGFDKMLNYANETMNHYNAYVGGDAYNYIINGSYCTAFFVLSAMFGIMFIGCRIIRRLDKNND